MFELDIEGFQSIGEKISLLIKGLTVVRGGTNQGKSAIIRAWLSPFLNRQSTYFISVGQDKCSVTHTEGDNTLTWTKSAKGTAKYKINDSDTFTSGKSIPEEVKQFGVFPIEVEGKKIWPQIHTQGDLPFLIGESSLSTIASIIGSDRTSRITSVGAKIGEKEKSIARQESVAAATAASLAWTYADEVAKIVEGGSPLPAQVKLIDIDKPLELLDRIEEIQALHEIVPRQVFDSEGIDIVIRLIAYFILPVDQISLLELPPLENVFKQIVPPLVKEVSGCSVEVVGEVLTTAKYVSELSTVQNYQEDESLRAVANWLTTGNLKEVGVPASLEISGLDAVVACVKKLAVLDSLEHEMSQVASLIEAIEKEIDPLRQEACNHCVICDGKGLAYASTSCDGGNGWGTGGAAEKAG